MKLYITGVNHKTTPLDMREKLNFGTARQKDALCCIKELAGVDECILISTCNRTEVYVHTNEQDFDSRLVEEALCEIKGLNLYDFKKHFYNYNGKKAVRHLFKVASGLDSMVLGEDQILGQVKAAHELAMETGTCSVVLNTLFRQAVTAAKKVKTDTELSKNSLSIASLAVKVMTGLFEDSLEIKKVMVIGAGKIGSIVLKNLSSKGVGKIYATSRNHGIAACQRNILGHVDYINYNDRYSHINECDIVISSTSSPHYTITRDMLEYSLSVSKPRLLIDLAVPRDIDIEVKNIEGVKYLNIDDLELEAGKNIDKRQLEAAKAEEIINEYVDEFEKWYDFRIVLPVIKDIQEYVEGVLEEKVSQTLGKLKSEYDEDKEIVKASITNTVNEILNKFVYSIRECSDSDDLKTYFRCLGNVVKTENEG